MGVVIFRYLMKPRPPETGQYISEARKLVGKREAVLQVTAIVEPIRLPKRLGYLRFDMSLWHHMTS